MQRLGAALSNGLDGPFTVLCTLLSWRLGEPQRGRDLCVCTCVRAFVLFAWKIKEPRGEEFRKQIIELCSSLVLGDFFTIPHFLLGEMVNSWSSRVHPLGIIFWPVPFPWWLMLSLRGAGVSQLIFRDPLLCSRPGIQRVGLYYWQKGTWNLIWTIGRSLDVEDIYVIRARKRAQ